LPKSTKNTALYCVVNHSRTIDSNVPRIPYIIYGIRGTLLSIVIVHSKHVKVIRGHTGPI